MWRRWSLVAAAWASCSVVDEPCYAINGRLSYTVYNQSPQKQSPRYGFAVDDPQNQLSLEVLDATVASVLACLQKQWPLMTSEDQEKGWCTGKPLLEAQQCLVVQVPPDWYQSTCTGNQVFPCSVPAQSCRDKGQEPTAECPCACRAIIQGQDTVVTAPNLELFPARLTELLTGCDQIWETPLAACGSPALRP